ncbi:hypothetical protein BDR07DRAFT_1380683, partial [Suillus spraguei]
MPFHLQVKNSIKVTLKDLNLLKGFAVRSRRPARNVSDMAQTFLPLIQGVSGAIPIAGSPMQAAISGLLTILQLIDDPLEQGRRDSIFKTFEELIRLQNCRPESASVTQAIARCSNQIDRYLADYSVVFYCLKIFWRVLTTSLYSRSAGNSTTEAAGFRGTAVNRHEHRISVTFCTSFQQLNVTLQALFTRDSIEARLQRRYMEQGQYDLCIDDDKQVTRLTNHEWPGIEAGTTIVMRVVFEEEKADFGVKRKCHFCRIRFSAMLVARSIVEYANDDFRSPRSSRAKRSTQSSDIDSDSRTEAEMHLIRNFYVQRTY